MAELIRTAVRETYLSREPDRRRIIEAILHMSLPVVEWKHARKEIEAAHADIP